MSGKVQRKRQMPFPDDLSGGKKRLPPVVLKGYLSPKHSPPDIDQDQDGLVARINAQNDQLKCSQCDGIFDRWIDLYKHCKSDHPKSESNDQPHDEDEGLESELISNINGSSHPDEENLDDIDQANGNSSDDTSSRTRTTWCEICKKHLATVSSRNLHMRIHTGERPFVCPFCNKAFTQNVHLRSHMSVHTGAKPYVCEICGKGFVAGRTLKIHMMSHTRDVPHVCKYCGRKFLLRNHLLLHTQTHHSDEGEDEILSPPTPKSPVVISPTIVPKRSSKSKYHLQPPQRVLAFNNPSTDDATATEESIDQSNDQSNRSDAVRQSQFEWPLNQSISIKTGSSEETVESESVVPQPPQSTNTPIQKTRLNNAKLSKSRSRDARKSIPAQHPTTDQSAGCPNCAIMDTELQLLKNELSVIKQFLGNKLTLMEQKIDNIRVLIK